MGDKHLYKIIAQIFCARDCIHRFCFPLPYNGVLLKSSLAGISFILFENLVNIFVLQEMKSACVTAV